MNINIEIERQTINKYQNTSSELIQNKHLEMKRNSIRNFNSDKNKLNFEYKFREKENIKGEELFWTIYERHFKSTVYTFTYYIVLFTIKFIW